MQYSENSKNSSKSTDADSEDAPHKKENIAYWRQWLKAARDGKKPQRHRKEASQAWDEYEKESSSVDSDRSEDSLERCYPIYWSSSKTLESAYYSRCPKTHAKRKHGRNDTAALLASSMAVTLSEYNIQNGDFHDTMMRIVQDFMHADKATGQVCYDAKITKEMKRYPMEVRGDKYYKQGELLPYEGDFYLDPDSNEPFYEEEVKHAENQRIYFAPAHFDEVFHTPDAKSPSEINEEAYYFCLTRDKAEGMFEPEVLEKINWKKSKTNKDEEDEKDEAEIPGEYVDGYEIWCKETRKIYFISVDCYPDGLLAIKPDEYKLRNFFPSPKFILGSTPRKHLYPTPAYVHLEPTIRQLHIAYKKVFQLIDGIRRRALIDGSCPELVEAFDSLGDQEFISVDNLGELVEKAKGVANLVWYLPVEELVNAIRELLELDGQFRNNFNEWFGVPDILRGVSDPMVTAKAEQMAVGSAHDRFKVQKEKIQELAREAIEMMLDLSVHVYSPEKIMQIVGYNYLSAEDQAAFPEALEILRNDEERIVRIEIQTDSTNFTNEIIDSQNRNAIVQTIMGGMKEITSMLQNGFPEFAALSMEATLYALEGIKGGEAFIEDFKGKAGALFEKAMNPPTTPPPPDYEAMKIELLGAKQRLEEFKAQRDLDRKDQELIIEAQKQASDQRLAEFKVITERQIADLAATIDAKLAAIEGFKAQIDDAKRMTEQQKTLGDMANKSRELDEKAKDNAANSEIALYKIENEKRINALYAALEKARLENDAMMNKFSIIERLMEEKRLAAESKAPVIKMTVPEPMSFMSVSDIERDAEGNLLRVVHKKMPEAA